MTTSIRRALFGFCVVALAAGCGSPTGPLPFFMELLCDPDGNVWMADYTNDRVGSASMSPRRSIAWLAASRRRRSDHGDFGSDWSKKSR
mgnify:CR=1 FL=1